MAKKVLVVDDEKLIVKGIRFSLEQDDMEVDCAYDGEEAVQKARENQYDIVLLDLMLPKLDGLQVCQQIREFSDVPIIMLTAKGEDMASALNTVRMTISRSLLIFLRSKPGSRPSCAERRQRLHRSRRRRSFRLETLSWTVMRAGCRSRERTSI